MEQIAFKRSSYCGSNACVEVGRTETEVHLRDSKDPSGPVLRFSPDQWSDFIATVRAGTY